MTDENAEVEPVPWTPEAREELRQSGEALIAAIRQQLNALDAAGPRSDMEELNRLGRAVDTAAATFSDCQNTWAGDYFSLFEVTSAESDEEFDGDPDEDDGVPEAIPVISVLQRAEYEVVDSSAVIAAAREAYSRTWESDSEEDAVLRINGLGVALYEIAHADGWDSLGNTPGLAPTGRIVNVIEPAELLDLEDDDEDSDDDGDVPHRAFAVEGRLLHAQLDHWRY